MKLRELLTMNLKVFKIWSARYPKVFIANALDALFTAAMPYVGIYVSAQLINELAGAREPKQLLFWVLTALISESMLALGKACFSHWKSYEENPTWYQNKHFYTEKLLDMDFCVLDQPETREKYSSINNHEMWFGWGLLRVIDHFRGMLQALLQISGAVILTISLFRSKVPAVSPYAVINHPLCSVLIIALMIAVLVISSMIRTKAGSYWGKAAEYIGPINRFYSFFGMMTMDPDRALDIRMYQQEREIQHYDEMMTNACSKNSEIIRKMYVPMGFFTSLAEMTFRVFIGVIYLFVCLKAWAGAYGVGSVTQYIGAFTSLASGIAAFMQEFTQMRNNSEFLKKAVEFLETPNPMYQGSLTVEKRRDRQYEVEFRDVSFKYPSASEYALRHVSMKFNVGERMAVVGMNGSGKTTFIKLLCRLYDPTEGQILLNGIDIRKYNYQEYMSIFSIVFQDFKLLSFTLGQNVTSSMEYDRARAEKCLEEAGFSARLAQLPEGLDTYLYHDYAEKGVDISGGEAQKIAIARALYKDAPFIILDEPTAALDPIAEYEIYTKFNEIVDDKTAIYISHRLSSCRFCDTIAVFDKGQVVQQGSHDALVADENGKYYELWNAQAQYYT